MKQAQTLNTQHTTVATQTDDTIVVSKDTITDTIDDIIDQILGGQEGSRLDITLDSRDGGGLDKSRVLELKQNGRDGEDQLKRMHLREHRKLLQSQKTSTI